MWRGNIIHLTEASIKCCISAKETEGYIASGLCFTIIAYLYVDWYTSTNFGIRLNGSLISSTSGVCIAFLP